MKRKNPNKIEKPKKINYGTAFTPARKLCSYVVVDDLLGDEAEKIWDIRETLKFREAEVLQEDGTSKEDVAYRKTDVAWIETVEANHWLYKRLISACQEVNKKTYGFQIYGLAEEVQWGNYDKDGYYDRHLDVGEWIIQSKGDPRPHCRKLSMSLLLTDPSEYEGGELILHKGRDCVLTIQKYQAVFFPSYMCHEVAPVTSGTRQSLVAWFSGPPFQ